LYKHIIWDFDGTLFDTYPVMGNIFKNMLEAEGIVESLDEILGHMKVSMSYALQHYERKYNISNTFKDKYNEQRNKMEIYLSKPYTGSQEACRYIHTSGKNNYLYTHRGESAIKFLKSYGMYDYFTDFITSQHGFERKPSPNAINYLVGKYNIIHNEAIMIGDRELDILSAKNAGIHGCYFTDSSEKSNIADFTINSFQQLYSIIS
jgi:HAD superfamily hydrolase (TIGR01549 family)